VNRVIVCSDGVANVGSDDARQMLDAVEHYREQGVTLTTVGVGSDDFNDQLLEQLANRGDGRYLYLGSVEDAYRQLVSDLAATTPTIARDVKIQVEFDPQRVRRYRLVGYENRDIADADFRNDAVDAGEIGSGQSATALYEVELIPAAQGTRAKDLGSVFVRYRDPNSGEVVESQTPLASDMIAGRTPQSDPRFYLAACAAEFAELLRESEHADHSSYEHLEQVMRQVSEALPLDADAAGLSELIHRSQGLPRAQR